ncbi:DnaA/Hda family protein, partial [Lysobacter sp. 2RAB21]
MKPLQATQRDTKTVLYAPNAFVVEHVRERYLGRIRELLSYFAGSDDVSLEIGSLPRIAPLPAREPDIAVSAPRPVAPPEPFQGNLDNHYTFDNFVEGRSNQLGRAAAWQAAQKPGERAHNPLLLYGGTGLGKTHLMFAAGNAMREANPAMRVMYLRSEQFFSAMMKALQDKTMDQFKRQFQRVDALLAKQRPGPTPIRLDLLRQGAAGMLDLNGPQSVRVDADLVGILRSQPGVTAVKLSLSKPWA